MSLRPDVSKKKSVILRLVVNGWPCNYKALRSSCWHSIIAPCIEFTGNTGRPVGDWELRNEAGSLIDLKQKIGRFDEEIRLFLNLRAGIGGAAA